MKYIFGVLIYLVVASSYALETTVYGKIVGIETRNGNMHVQTDFSGGASLNCGVTAGTLYMYDFLSSEQGEGADFVRSVILSAFIAQKDVSFHLYKCNSNNARPVIGHVRIK